MKINRFEDLQIWQASLRITRDVYDLTKQKDFNYDFALHDQVRKSVISISSNIVEGFENNNNEFIRFLKIAKGSIGELRNQLYIALTVGYINQQQFEKINKELEDLSNQTGKLISYLEKCRSQGNFVRK